VSTLALDTTGTRRRFTVWSVKRDAAAALRAHRAEMTARGELAGASR
jgi:hypothetical protein